jgi:hypothetical protein
LRIPLLIILLFAMIQESQLESKPRQNTIHNLSGGRQQVLMFKSQTNKQLIQFRFVPVSVEPKR